MPASATASSAYSSAAAYQSPQKPARCLRLAPIKTVTHSASAQKLKKNGKGPPNLRLVENPDILASIASRSNDRPALVIGFAAETENVVANARAKRQRKGCDWILANDVSLGTGTFGGERNTVHLVDGQTVEDWPAMTKREVAERLAERIAVALAPDTATAPASPRVPGAGH